MDRNSLHPPSNSRREGFCAHDTTKKQHNRQQTKADDINSPLNIEESIQYNTLALDYNYGGIKCSLLNKTQRRTQNIWISVE